MGHTSTVPSVPRSRKAQEIRVLSSQTRVGEMTWPHCFMVVSTTFRKTRLWQRFLGTSKRAKLGQTFAPESNVAIGDVQRSWISALPHGGPYIRLPENIACSSCVSGWNLHPAMSVLDCNLLANQLHPPLRSLVIFKRLHEWTCPTPKLHPIEAL